ncbi:circularly permuted type 2 ATP-grasp protein [Rhodoferax saidenbachensis]|uniref:A circularly permuted ATPgrasp family protein n=1 Tax=Rhodoferax saidenbachensis TaxID=1484693 RepID=A0A1P8KBI8_9BURK|nr:circularly permuted type 2 ATP-grasp protein [Rhodoferax saidenbachensis]APW43368.1 A circularly permuted ATPgrasp family protein [Rhodoferax saidenbachensis]
MKDANESPTAAATRKPSEVLSSASDCIASTGHYDELRGRASNSGAQAPSSASESAINSVADCADFTGAWGQFFAHVEAQTRADLDQRSASLQRQIRDNGVTYNVYADEEGPQRPWSLDLFPLIIDAPSWQQIEVGVQQRMRLLEAVMTDVYGPQSFMAQGLLPPALVQGHPGYLRPMHGVKPVGGTHLHVASFDLARGPDGNWWVVGQRCQAPSGLGYLLENRLAVSRQFPQAFQHLKVQRLAGTYRALMDSLKAMSPLGKDAHIALLTPGPYNETYFEHAYLARYLGLSLVEGSDLIVRDERLFLKTLRGLVPVHGLLKRVDDQYLDPLELRPDSTLGVPGLLQAIRAGNVLVANAPGSAFLESPALLGFLPALARHVLQEELLLPALPTWWCGERSAMQEALPLLGERAIKPTYPGSPIHGSFDAVLGHTLDQTELDAWAGRIMRQSEDHTVQAYLPLSQLPTWQTTTTGDTDTAHGHMVARSVLLRVFAVSDGTHPATGQPRWRILPGGLARVAGASADIASMQRGGSSADVWALTQGEIDTTTLLPQALTPATLAQHKRLVTSRAAENLYWLGRYTERAENSIRLARLTLEALGGEDQTSPPLLQWLSKMAVANTLVLPGVPSALQARRVFERSLISSLGATDGATSVGYNLRALKMAGATVRERLSQEHWSVIVRAEEELFARCARLTLHGEYASTEALRVLKSASDHLAAITGAQTDRMTRDDGWRLLSIGRHVERLNFLAAALARGFEAGAVHSEGGFEALLGLFDSTITFHAQYQQSRDVAAMVNLLVLDRDNPRSLAWVAHTLRGRLAKLAGMATGVLSPLSLRVPDPDGWELAELCETTTTSTEPPALMELLDALGHAAYAVSDDISTTYFTHSGETKTSVGT